MADQITIPLPVRTALGRDDFFVSPSNAVALGLIETWPNWSGGKLVLCGPEGAGKTHLAHVWAETSEAQIIAACDLDEAAVPGLAAGPVVVEDIDDIADDSAAQTALFHLHNLVLAGGNSLLLTGTGDPKHWGLTLPDLASRMMGTTVAALEDPDDDLLAAVMMKLFSDRQILPGPETLAYLLKHMDRTFAAARDIVGRLDQLSLTEGRPVNRNLARRIVTEE